jgi:hypothetical protein
MTCSQQIELHSHISAEKFISPKSKYFQNGCKKVTNSYSTLSQLLIESIYRGGIEQKSHNSREPFPLRKDWDRKLVCGWFNEPEYDFWVNPQNDDCDYEDEDWNEQQFWLLDAFFVFRFLPIHVVY